MTAQDTLQKQSNQHQHPPSPPEKSTNATLTLPHHNFNQTNEISHACMHDTHLPKHPHDGIVTEHNMESSKSHTALQDPHPFISLSTNPPPLSYPISFSHHHPFQPLSSYNHNISLKRRYKSFNHTTFLPPPPSLLPPPSTSPFECLSCLTFSPNSTTFLSIHLPNSAKRK